MRYTLLSGLSRLKFAAVASIFTLPSICFSGSLAINCGSPYASGSITIQNTGIPAVPKYSFDTIKFSNGISLSFFDQTSSIPEPARLFHGISISNSTNLIKAGFRYLPSATWEKIAADSSIRFYASNDTVWALSKRYPDSLMFLDSLYNSGHVSVSKSGKWLYYTDGDLTFGDWAATIKNYTNIIYLQGTQSKMKLQISNLAIHASVGMQTRVDSLRIVWAVDSQGTGQFKDFTNIKSINKYFGNIEKQPSFNRRNGNGLRFFQSSGGRISIFDVRGRQFQILPNSWRVMPKGVFIYKSDNSKASAWGKLLMRYQ